MTFNDPTFIGEFKQHVAELSGVKRILEVGCQSGELKDAVGADGVDINPQRGDVVKVDIREFKPTKKYDLVFGSGLLEHYSKEEAAEILKAMGAVLVKSGYVLTYVPNGGCVAYKNDKVRTKAPWKDELDYTPDELAELHEQAGLRVVKTGYAAQEWAKRFGPEPSGPYLCYVLARK